LSLDRFQDNCIRPREESKRRCGYSADKVRIRSQPWKPDRRPLDYDFNKNTQRSPPSSDSPIRRASHDPRSPVFFACLQLTFLDSTFIWAVVACRFSAVLTGLRTVINAQLASGSVAFDLYVCPRAFQIDKFQSKIGASPDRCSFAAQSMDFEVTAEVFMPIRITRPDKSLHGMQPYEIKRLVAAHSDESTACYTDRKLKFRILCGSI